MVIAAIVTDGVYVHLQPWLTDVPFVPAGQATFWHWPEKDIVPKFQVIALLFNPGGQVQTLGDV